MSSKRALVLMGIKHCGKSTQGRLLSSHFDCPFIDTDDEITRLTGKSPRALYTEDGEQAFKAAEAEVCRQLAERFSTAVTAGATAALESAITAGEPAEASESAHFSCVIATGGGIVTNEPAVEALSAFGLLVFLCADEKIALARIIREVSVATDGSLRNLPAYIAREKPASLDDVRAIFHRFYEERSARYAKCCPVTVQMVAVPAEQNMAQILLHVQNY